MTDNHTEFLHRIDSRVDEIAERVSEIEGKLYDKSQKSFLKKLSEYGGLMALILSLLIGSFTLYDKLLLQPNKEKKEAIVNFRNDINELLNIHARVAGLDWGNFQAANFQMQAWTPQRMALLEKILLSDKTMPEVLKYADRIALANEHEFFGHIKEAMEQARLAKQLSVDAIQRANANWVEARLSGKLNELNKMRDFFIQTLNEFKTVGLKNVAINVMTVYLQWISLELANGTCSSAQDAHARMINDFILPDVPPRVKEEIKKQFEKMLTGAPKNCGLSLN